MPDQIICVDIGSTYTKGAVFRMTESIFSVEKRAVAPTTVENLPDGFYAVLEKLLPDCDVRSLDASSSPCPIYFSSSAKGGLKVAVVGLVPEMSLNIARLAAFSAGAKICASYPYQLTASHIKKIEAEKPDILLLCGGTDGGNEKYVTENAKTIAASAFKGTVVYAGNSYAADTVAELLGDKEHVIVENVMPDFGKLNIEPVRMAIRKIFLDKIVSGKGLDKLVKAFNIQPVPTPLAVYNLVKAIGSSLKEWNNFALIDMGGATTDFYSNGKSYDPDSNTVMKGIIEPNLKRTVEGDLGMRVSAEAAYETGEEYIRSVSGYDDDEMTAYKTFIDKVHTDTDYLPADDKEKAYDRYLASACIYHSILRHCGTIEEVYTCNGRVWAQVGKDLRKVTRIVGTGGYLAAMGRNGEQIVIPNKPVQMTEKMPLLPQKFEYYSDSSYIWPLLGNLAEKYPVQCANTAVNVLMKMDETNGKE